MFRWECFFLGGKFYLLLDKIKYLTVQVNGLHDFWAEVRFQPLHSNTPIKMVLKDLQSEWLTQLGYSFFSITDVIVKNGNICTKNPVMGRDNGIITHDWPGFQSASLELVTSATPNIIPCLAA